MAPVTGSFRFHRQIGTELITGSVFHRHISAESYRRVVFHRHIGAGSCQQVGRLQRQQYDASTGSGG